MFHTKKGEYGYIRARKYSQLLLALLMAFIGFAIYGIGFVVNGWKQNNICLVLGILMVLPGAKFLVTYILLFPYHTPDKELYEEMKSRAPRQGTFLSDLVITSEQKAMNLDFLYVGNGCVCALTGKKNEATKKIQDYLTKGVRTYGASYQVRITDSKDNFRKTLKGIEKKTMDQEEENRVLAWIYSLIV